MPLTEQQVEWVGKVSKTALKAEHFEKQQATRKAKLEELDSYYASKLKDAMPELVGIVSDAVANMTMKEVLSKGLNLKAMMETTDGKMVEGATLEKDGSQIDEVDATEIDTADLLEMNDQDQIDLSMYAFSVMNGAKNILEGAKVTDEDGNDEAVFEAEDLSEYMFQSLVRERALGETMVPDEFSQTQKMLDKTNAYYNEDLAEFTEANKDKQEDDAIHKALGTGSKLGTITSNLVSALPIENAKLASDIAKLASLGLDTIDSGREAVKKGDFRNASRGILDNVDKLASGILSLAMGEDAGKLVGSLVTASLTGGKMTASLAQKPPDIDGAIVALTTGIEGAFTFAAGSQGDSNEDKARADQLKAISKTVKGAIQAAAKARNLPDRIKNKDVAGLVDDMTAVAKSGLECATSFKVAEDKKAMREELGDGASEKEVKAAMAKIDKEAKKALDAQTALADLAATGVKTTAVVITAAKTKEIRKAADDIVAGVGKAFAGALKAAGVPSATISILTASYSAASNAGMIVTHMTASPPDKTKAFACIGVAIGSSLEAAAGKNTDMIKAAKAVTLSFQAGASGVDIGVAIKDGKYDQAVKSLASIADKAVTSALAIESADGTKEEKSAAGKTAKEASKGKGKSAEKDITGKAIDHGGIEKVKSDALAFLTASEEKIKENIEAVTAKEKEEEEAEKAEAEAEVAAMLDAQNEVLDKIRQGSAADQSAASASAIEKLVADLQKDRMILDLAVKVGSGATALASQFVPALGAATAGIQLAASLIAAANRAMALNEWMKSQQDFAKAQSALSASAASFVGQQKEQFSYYTIQAALDLAKVIGEAVKSSGVASAAGAAVSAAADAGKSTQDLIREFYKEAEMKRAWKITQKALQNPTNRRLGLEAQKMNPTLAKYAMAWAAVDNNDPLAKAAVRQCGLTDATLRNPETNVKNVQKYFEVYFNEDTQVRGVIEIQADWLPSKIELSLKCWSTVQSRAVKQGNLVKVPTGKVDRLLAEMVGQESKVGVADDVLDQDDLSAYLASLDQLENELENYASMARNSKTQGAHKEVQGVVEMMLGELSEKRSGANSRVAVAV